MKKGFTLVELLVALGVLAIMAGLTLSLIGRGPQQRTRDARRLADINKIASALELYRADCSGYPSTGSCAGGGCLTAYINNIPRDPVSNANYSYANTGSCAGGAAPPGCNFGRCQGFRICADLEQTIGTCAGNTEPTGVVTNP